MATWVDECQSTYLNGCENRWRNSLWPDRLRFNLQSLHSRIIWLHRTGKLTIFSFSNQWCTIQIRSYWCPIRLCLSAWINQRFGPRNDWLSAAVHVGTNSYAVVCPSLLFNFNCVKTFLPISIRFVVYFTLSTSFHVLISQTMSVSEILSSCGMSSFYIDNGLQKKCSSIPVFDFIPQLSRWNARGTQVEGHFTL